MALTIPQGLEVAGTLVNSLRDKFPDPVYTGSPPTPQPDIDGSRIRAQTIYRWLTSGIRDMGRRIGFQVQDWWAMPLAAKQNLYPLDARWRQVWLCFVNQYRAVMVPEQRTIWPQTSATVGSQTVTFDIHTRTGALDISLWPAPGGTDPVTTLAGAVQPTDTTIALASSSSFLSYGYARIEQELLAYNAIQGTSLTAIRRGVAGTAAVAHSAGVQVVSCGLWVRGVRSPNPVALAADPVELPYDALEGLEAFVMAQYKMFEQDEAAARAHREMYIEVCESIKRDPKSQAVPEAAQIAPYGGSGNGLYWYDGFDGVVVR